MTNTHAHGTGFTSQAHVHIHTIWPNQARTQAATTAHSHMLRFSLKMQAQTGESAWAAGRRFKVAGVWNRDTVWCKSMLCIVQFKWISRNIHLYICDMFFSQSDCLSLTGMKEKWGVREGSFKVHRYIYRNKNRITFHYPHFQFHIFNVAIIFLKPYSIRINTNLIKTQQCLE